MPGDLGGEHLDGHGLAGVGGQHGGGDQPLPKVGVGVAVAAAVVAGQASQVGDVGFG
jgi:hypothetical protein